MMSIRTVQILALAALCTLTALPVDAQWWRGRGQGFPAPPKVDEFSGKFTFCTIMYDPARSEDLGFGWNTDYPNAGEHFMIRLEELTSIEIARDQFGQPHQVNLRLTDPALFNYPYIFMSDVGTVDFNPVEQEKLREYLLRGGFLHVDDFWGDLAWEWWVDKISEVLPPDEFKIRDIPLSHPIFHIVFDVKEVPQVPSIQHWERSGGRTTSERGSETDEPHIRGIWHGDRLIVLMSHNTDLADGWEKEGENEQYFREFSVTKSYPMGINIVVYALTH